MFGQKALAIIAFFGQHRRAQRSQNGGLEFVEPGIVAVQVMEVAVLNAMHTEHFEFLSPASPLAQWTSGPIPCRPVYPAGVKPEPSAVPRAQRPS